MCFNLHEVYTLQSCNCRVFRVFKFTVAGYSGVEIFAGEISVDIRSESAYHNSIRQLQRCKTCWTRFSAAYLGFLGLCDGLVILAPDDPMATDPLCSAVAMRVVLLLLPYSLCH